MTRRLLFPYVFSTLACVSASTRELREAPAVLAAVRRAEVPERSRDAGEASLAQPLARDAVVRAVVARDPGLAAQAHRVRAMLHGARAEGSLPAPEANVQVWNLPLARPYALGEAQMYMVELRQGLPAPGSLDARSRAAAEDARAMVAELVLRERELTRRAADAYADYVGATLHHAIHDAHLRLLEEMLAVARARYAAGGAPFAEVVRLEGERARVRRSLARYAADEARARVALNGLLLRPPGAPLGPPRDLEPETVRATRDELLARAAVSRAEIDQARARERAARARTEAMRAEASWPMFMVALSYWQDPGMRPGLGAMASMSLPWLWGGARARVEEARAREAAEASAVRLAEVEARAEVATVAERLAGIERELAVLHDEMLPAARRSIDAERAAYLGAGTPLLAWIDAARMSLDVVMEEADLRIELARAVAELERVVGAALPRRVLGAGEEVLP